jgi:predicted dehydrogenase
MRIGMMSFAHLHAEAYINCLRAVPGLVMIGIADDDLTRGRRFADQFGAHLFDNYGALLAEKPDGVVICGENAKHRELVEMAAAAGVQHILCEKPLATTMEDGRAMLKACEEAGVRLMTAFPMRFSAPARQVKTALERGDLGAVRCCIGTNQGQNPHHHRAWFTHKALAGGGAAMDHAVHVVDMLRWYLGSEVVEVFAEIDNLFHKDTLDIDTAGLLLMTFDNGVFASLDCSWSRPRYYPIWGNVKLDLVCEQGVLQSSYFVQNITVYSDVVQRPVWNFWGSDPNQAMIDEFATSIWEDRAPSVSGEDGLKALEVALAAYRSAEMHQPVALPLA